MAWTFLKQNIFVNLASKSVNEHSYLLLLKERSIGPRLKIGNSSLGLFLSMDQEIDMLSWHNSYFFALSIGDIIDNVGVPIEESSSFLYRDHFEILQIEIAQSSNKRVEVLEFIHEI